MVQFEFQELSRIWTAVANSSRCVKVILLKLNPPFLFPVDLFTFCWFCSLCISCLYCCISDIKLSLISPTEEISWHCWGRGEKKELLFSVGLCAFFWGVHCRSTLDWKSAHKTKYILMFWLFCLADLFLQNWKVYQNSHSVWSFGRKNLWFIFKLHLWVS